MFISFWILTLCFPFTIPYTHVFCFEEVKNVTVFSQASRRKFIDEIKWFLRSGKTWDGWAGIPATKQASWTMGINPKENALTTDQKITDHPAVMTVSYYPYSSIFNSLPKREIKIFKYHVWKKIFRHTPSRLPLFNVGKWRKYLQWKVAEINLFQSLKTPSFRIPR